MKKIAIILILAISLAALAACVKNGGKPAEFLKDVNEYQISLNISDDLKCVNISQVITVVNNSDDDWDYVILNVYANAYTKDCPNTAYYFAPSVYASLNILGITSGGKTVESAFAQNMTTLKVEQPIAKGQKTTIEIEAELIVPITNLRLGLNMDVLNLTGFYPIVAVYDDGWRQDNYCKVGDPFFAQSADYNVEIICNKDLIVAASADTYSEVITDVKKTINIAAKSIRDFALSASYNFQMQQGAYNNTQINYYHIGSNHPEISLQTAINALSTFSDLLGEYPYQYFSIVDIPYYYGGMEYSNIVYVNSASADKDAVIIHETAHQWFGMMVGSDPINQSWLDEALVTFLTDYYHAKNNDEQRFATLRQENRKMSEDFSLLQKKLNPKINFDLNKSIYEYVNNYEYSMIVYTRGSVLFDIIYEYAGQKRFESAIKDYYNQNCYKIACKADLFKAFKDNKKDIEPIVNSFLNDTTLIGAYIPVFA